MSKFVILHKRKTPHIRLCCIMKVTKQTLQHLRKKEGVSRKYYTSFFIYIQPVKRIKLMQILFEPCDKSSYEHLDQYFYFGISWKNYGFC